MRSLWLALRGSLWFVPALLVAAAVSLALLLIELESRLQYDLSREWPRLFGVGAEGSRAMLTAIATSMITVAGVVFSVTIVALSLAASQYSPRVLRNFMSDRPTQVVLGAFVAVFAYCLIVLRTIRGGDEGEFVPSIAVVGGVLMAFVGIGLLIYFVHHVATAIQVTSIVERIASDTLGAIERLYPAGVGSDLLDEQPGADARLPTGAWTPIVATHSGYIVAIDAARLLELATGADTVLRVPRQIGDFVARGTEIAEVAPGCLRSTEALAASVTACFALGGERDVDQDAAFGIQQLVDVALKALSPSVHDPSTAGTCIDHLGALLHRLSARRIEGRLREREGRLRLELERPGYDDLVRLALGAVTHHAGSHASVHARLVAAVALASQATADPVRRDVLARRLQIHLERLAQCDLDGQGRQWLQSRITGLRDRLLRDRLEREAGRRDDGGQHTC